MVLTLPENLENKIGKQEKGHKNSTDVGVSYEVMKTGPTRSLSTLTHTIL